MIPVTDESGEIIAQVESNNRLDYWNGSNWTSGELGRHIGFTSLPDGRYVLIHGTQWAKEQPSAEVVSAERIVKEAIRTGNQDELKEYPELIEILDSFPTDFEIKNSKTFAIRVRIHDTEDEINEKIAQMREKIGAYQAKID